MDKVGLAGYEGPSRWAMLNNDVNPNGLSCNNSNKKYEVMDGFRERMLYLLRQKE